MASEASRGAPEVSRAPGWYGSRFGGILDALRQGKLQGPWISLFGATIHEQLMAWHDSWLGMTPSDGLRKVAAMDAPQFEGFCKGSTR